MENILPVRPVYAARFRCIGAQCEDSCCHHWSVPVDGPALARFRVLPDLPVGAELRHAIEPIEGCSVGDSTTPVARIRLKADRLCPMLSGEGLCRIQSAHGEAALPHVCQTFPRILNQEQGAQEVSLTFSCPEAARLVLLDPELRTHGFIRIENQVEDERDRTDADTVARIPLSHFWQVRGTVLSLIGNRDYPLWQRLFLINLLCHRLDQVGDGRLNISVPEFLRAFGDAVARGALRTGMEALPTDNRRQLDLVLTLAGSMLRVGGVLEGFGETIAAFTGGIGNGPGATLDSLTRHYERAHEDFFAPFFAARPYILENYLINTVFRCRFPFGAHDQAGRAQPSLVREFDKLLAQFALIKGLLIGIAGRYGERFSTGHVIHTFQSAAKHFEHHPEFFERALGIMAESGLAGGSGSAILARNSPAFRAMQRTTMPEIQPSMSPQLQTETGPV